MRDLTRATCVTGPEVTFMQKCGAFHTAPRTRISRIKWVLQDMEPLHGSAESCSGATVGNQGVHTWSSSFEKLLEDPKGLETFAEFLKKEFSHENIHFWTSCEKYMAVEDPIVRRKLASQIYQRHLSSAASEPVNVDSDAAGKITQELLNLAPVDLFSQSQKQVFNLMKFDSYPRFLRSELYRRCVESANEGTSSTNSSPGVKLKKSHSDAEDRCRKSILPWHRKNRETEGQNNNEDNISISSSRSSLASWDLALRQSFNKHSVSSYDGHSNDKNEIHAKCTGLCRVILPDGSTTVVPTNQTESVKDVVTRLLDKRALQYTIYDVIVLTTNEIVNLKCSSSILAGQEVEVVPTKTLKVDLPSHRTITVVAHKGRTLGEVLKPLLNKYGYKLESCSIWNDGRAVSLDILAINAPARIILSGNGSEPPQETAKCHDESQRGQTTLDEITNKVFEELLVGKSTKSCNFSEGSCKSEDQRSESSSILSSKFFTRDSTLSKKKSKSKTTDRSTSSDRATEESTRSHAPLIAKWKNGVKLQLPSKFDDDLYEGLKRAQRSRLDDQRGTEINFELPDFLKDKENGKATIGKKSRKFRNIGSTSSDNSAKFYDTIEEKPNSSKSSSASCSPRKAPEVSDEHNTSGENLWDKTNSDMDQTVVENGFTPKNIDLALSLSLSPSKSSKPPPLPPKPKNLMANITKNNGPANSRPFHKSNGVEPAPRNDV